MLHRTDLFFFVIGKMEFLCYQMGSLSKQIKHVPQSLHQGAFFCTGVGGKVCIPVFFGKKLWQVFSTFSGGFSEASQDSAIPAQHFVKLRAYGRIHHFQSICGFVPPNSLCRIAGNPPKFITASRKFFLGGFFHPIGRIVRGRQRRKSMVFIQKTNY